MAQDIITLFNRDDDEIYGRNQARNIQNSLMWSSVSIPIPCPPIPNTSIWGEIPVPPPVLNPENVTIKEYQPYYSNLKGEGEETKMETDEK